jgi:hypothetical protein
MTTDHINRWNGMNDSEFIDSARHYRRFRHVNTTEHSINIDYLVKRCDSLGYDFTPGCCGKFTVTKRMENNNG